MNKEPRLRFTDEERSDPALEKPIRKAEKAAARADKAQANIPKKRVRQTVIDPDTGKKTSKLTFEDKKKPPSKLSQGVREAPVHLVAGKLHKEIREKEQDNVGVESAHKSEEAVETGAYLVREGYRSHKLKPYRKAAQAERQLEKANVNVLYQKSLQENPRFASNPLSRWRQKQAIKKQYAAAKHAGQTAGNTAQAASKTGKAARTVKEKAQQAGAFVMRHKKGFLMAGVLFLITCMLMNTIFEEWCSFLNFFDSSIRFELSFMNMATDASNFEKMVRIPYQKDHFNPVRTEYSTMLRRQLAQGNNGLTKTKYLTFGIEAESMKQAKPRLIHIEIDLMNNFKRLGVRAKLLNGKERLHLMHDMFHMGDHDRFNFDWKWLPESGLSVKDFIAPTGFAFPKNRIFQMGGMYGSMSYLQITASDLSDQLLKDFSGYGIQPDRDHAHSVGRPEQSNQVH